MRREGDEHDRDAKELDMSERVALEAEFRKLLMQKVDDANDHIMEIAKRMDEFESVVKQLTLDMAVLQLKAGVWGTVGGLVTIVAAYLLKQMFKG